MSGPTRHGFLIALVAIVVALLWWRHESSSTSSFSAPAPRATGLGPGASGGGSSSNKRGAATGGSAEPGIDCDEDPSRHGLKRIFEDTVKALEGCPEYQRRLRARGQAQAVR